MGWYGMMGGTNRVGALEGAPEQAAVRGGDAQVLVALGPRHRDQLAEQHGADALPAHLAFDAEGNLGNAVVRLLRRMQLGRTAHRAVLEIGDDDGAVIGAFLGVFLDEAVVHEAMEAIMAAGSIQS